MQLRHPVLAFLVLTSVACNSLEDVGAGEQETIDQSTAEATTSGGNCWNGLIVDTSAALHKVKVTSSQPLAVNSPFLGITVLQNGVDITNDITNIRVANGTWESGTGWEYTFATKKFSGTDTIEVRLNNTQRALPGHYVAVPEGWGTVQGLHKRLVDCEGASVSGPNGQGDCANEPKMPNLVANVKGFSNRYRPRDLVSPSGSAFNFKAVFDDAKFLSEKGKRLNVIFTVKSFGAPKIYTGNGLNRTFAIDNPGWQPNLPASDPNKGRPREVHVYVRAPHAPNSALPPLVEVAHPDTSPPAASTNRFWFSNSGASVTLGFAPPAGSEVHVAYSPDPFPAYVWDTMTPKPYGWYAGNNPDHQSFGFIHKPWEQTARTWMASFMKAFRKAWDQSIANDGLPANAIESITLQESSNAIATDLYATDWTIRNRNIDGLAEYAKILARTVRGRAISELLINQVIGQNKNSSNEPAINAGLRELANKIIPWGTRLGGPDLFNFDTGPTDIPEGNYGNSGLEFGVYDAVHREQHNRALTMVWAQNDSHWEQRPAGGFFSMEDQYKKAQRPIGTNVWGPTPTVQYKGLEAEYIFWNMTPQENPNAFGWADTLRVIAAHPTIQTTVNHRNLWRRAADGTTIDAQWVKKQP